MSDGVVTVHEYVLSEEQLDALADRKGRRHRGAPRYRDALRECRQEDAVEPRAPHRILGAVRARLSRRQERAPRAIGYQREHPEPGTKLFWTALHSVVGVVQRHYAASRRAGRAGFRDAGIR